MCGIVGIASQNPVANGSWLKDSQEAMFHRGPDDSGSWWSKDDCVGLGHRRLAIVDLSPAGHQPMLDSNEEFSIVFNGEIYNLVDLHKELSNRGHVFRSHSDTEVILAAYREWGIECLSHLNGMFSFALYDSRDRKMFLARDRAGEKPLFYSLSNGSLRFSSELKGLMADPGFTRQINLEAMDCYLAMGFVPGEQCILTGVKKLPPAHALIFDLNRGLSHLWRYWDMPEYSYLASSKKVDESALLEELEVLLEDSVRRQLVADVPVGVLLSGGVDSSLITAMAVRSSTKVKTFTIRFPGHEKQDETEHARLIAQHFDTEHVELEAQPTTADLIPNLARQFDEPIVDSSMIPTFLVSKLVRQHCTVALGGDGGDELFGGYHHYSRLLWMQNRLGWIPQLLRQAISLGAERMLPVGLKGRNWLQGLGVELKSGLPLIASYFDAGIREQLMAGKSNWSLVAEDIRKQRVPEVADLLQRATRMDFQNYLAEDILVKVDRASMLNSLEVRAPYLDYRLIEFAFGKVPSYLKATSNNKKILLKRLTHSVLPPNFDRQRKQGFSIPLVSWLKDGAFRELFHDTLLDSRSIFDMSTVRGLLDGQDRGRNNSERLFSLVLFELWRREYAINF